jgi:hyaluronan synthase
MTIIFGLLPTKRREPFSPTVSIIVPVYNEEKYIGETIRRLVQNEYPSNKREIIVVNTGSTDRTWDEIKPFVDKGYIIGINIIERKSKREAVYEGLKIAKGEITILVDSDSFLEPTAIKEIVKPFKDPKVGAVAGNIKVANPQSFLRKFQDSFYHWNFEFVMKTQGRFGAVACCGGPFAAYRTSRLKEVAEQWKNETFFGYPATFGDDRDLTLRFFKNYDVVFAPEAVAYVNVPDTFHKFIKQLIRWKKGWIRNTAKMIKSFYVKSPVIALYNYAMLILSYTLPFSALYFLLIRPLVFAEVSWLFLGVTLSTGMVCALHQKVLNSSESWKYRILSSLFFLLAYPVLTFYALFTVKDSSWGTR